jgi:hypothetical protein
MRKKSMYLILFVKSVDQTYFQITLFFFKNSIYFTQNNIALQSK